MTGLRLKVTTYAGYRADERPTSFTLGERTFQVLEILDSWHGEDHTSSSLPMTASCTSSGTIAPQTSGS